MLDLHMTLDVAPTPQGRARHAVRCGHAVAYKAQRQRDVEATLDALLAPHAPKAPLQGPLVLEFVAALPVGKSDSKKAREAKLGGLIAPTGKPDIFIKGFLEASKMNGVTVKKTTGSSLLGRVSEHDEQVQLMRVCRLHEKKYPGLELIYAVPNGGARHVAVARKLKAEGVKAGVPDLFLPVPRGQCPGLYIELKAKGGRVSDAQREMLAALSRQGYACVVAVGWENAWLEIEAYMKTSAVYTGYLVEKAVDNTVGGLRDDQP